MTVRELIDELNGFDETDLVLLSSDPEGNSHSVLHEVSMGAWDKDNEIVGIRELTSQGIEIGCTEEDVIPNGKPCCVLWPTK